MEMTTPAIGLRGGPLLRFFEAQAAASKPYTPPLWFPYEGGDAILLAIVLLVVAGGFANFGKRLRVPLSISRPDRVAAGFMIAIWLLSIATFLAAVFVYGLQMKQAHPDFVAHQPRVGTFVDATVTFFVILYLTRHWGWKIALLSAFVGMAAAPMLFEFPFDLIVMARTNPPIPDHPMLYRALFFRRSFRSSRRWPPDQCTSTRSTASEPSTASPKTLARTSTSCSTSPSKWSPRTA